MTHHRTNRKTIFPITVITAKPDARENELWYRLNNNRLGNIHFGDSMPSGHILSIFALSNAN
jgi:hypothetical protein